MPVAARNGRGRSPRHDASPRWLADAEGAAAGRHGRRVGPGAGSPCRDGRTALS